MNEKEKTWAGWGGAKLFYNIKQVSYATSAVTTQNHFSLTILIMRIAPIQYFVIISQIMHNIF